jgi:hypothetical protein
MHLISFEEYVGYISQVRTTFGEEKDQWNYYISYVIHETAWWEAYFKGIFLKNFEIKNPIQIVFWESGPGIELERSQLPHPNYAFYNLAKKLKKEDSYLAQIYNISCNKANSNIDNATKKDILIEISEKNYLIIDLYPTHAIKLNKDARKKFSKIFKEYTIRKLQEIKKEIQKENAKGDLLFNNETFCPARIGKYFLPAQLIKNNIKELNDFINSKDFKVVRDKDKLTKKKINSSPKNNP